MHNIDKEINTSVYTQADFAKDPTSCKGKIPDYLCKSILTEVTHRIESDSQLETDKAILLKAEKITDLTKSNLIKFAVWTVVKVCLQRLSFDTNLKLYDASVWKVYT